LILGLAVDLIIKDCLIRLPSLNY